MFNARQRNAADDCVSYLFSLNGLAITDPEMAHGLADEALLRFVGQIGAVQTDDVVKAYRALEERAPWWAAS